MAKIQLLSSILKILIVLVFISHTQGAIQHGFTTNLIHRDSPLSPFHNPSLSKWDHIRMSFDRSISRANYFRESSLVSLDDIQAQVSGAGGAYVMEVYVGTPPVRQLGIADTGSDLIWTQCQPCDSCYKQTIPIFNPQKSSSYKVQPCESKGCQALGSELGSCTGRDTCQYHYSYGDQSQSIGDLSWETLSFKSIDLSDDVSYPKVTFGCGHYNKGTFTETGSGLIGLGGGPLSLVSQLSSSINGKFSYCLIPFFEKYNSTSTINFGTKGIVSGTDDVVSTPLVKGFRDTFYFLTLEAISVNNVRLPFTTHNHSNNLDDYGGQEGNIIIDSGTTLTFLPFDLYNELTNTLVKVIKGNQVEDPSGTLQLCYQATEDLNIPNLTAHFTGADIELKPMNTFIKVSENVVCLAMLHSDNIAIYGNIAQVNFLVGYDTEEGKVSFKPVDCTKGY